MPEILEELSRALKCHRNAIDHVTFAGEGEPALCRSLGYLIKHVKKMTDIPIAVLTNSSLFPCKAVRDAIGHADVVLPSLDAADEATYRKVNRPHGSLRIREIIEGIESFQRTYNGRLWVETMLVRGLNDNEDALHALREAMDRIKPDRLYLSVPHRPPAEDWVEAPDPTRLMLAESILEDVYHLELPEPGGFDTEGISDPIDAVRRIVRGHPMRQDQLMEVLHLRSPDMLNDIVQGMEIDGVVHRIKYKGNVYYTAGSTRR